MFRVPCLTALRVVGLAASISLTGCSFKISGEPDPPDVAPVVAPAEPAPKPISGTVAGQQVDMRPIANGPSRVDLGLDNKLYLADVSGLFPSVRVIIKLPIEAPLDAAGRSFSVQPEDDGVVTIDAAWREGDQDRKASYSTGIRMELSFEDAERARTMRGELSLSLPDEQQSALAGSFIATAARDWSHPPLPAEAPAVHGTITSRGYKAPPIRVIYQGFGEPLPGTPTDDLRRHTTPLTIGVSGYGASVLNGRFESQASRADAGQDVTFQHLFLVPGPYVFMVVVDSGLADWRWINVQEDDIVELNLMADRARTGTLAVVLPESEADLPPGDETPAFLLPLPGEGAPPVDDAMLLGAGIRVDRGSGSFVSEGVREGRYLLSWGEERAELQIRAGQKTTVQMGR